MSPCDRRTETAFSVVVQRCNVCRDSVLMSGGAMNKEG